MTEFHVAMDLGPGPMVGATILAEAGLRQVRVALTRGAKPTEDAPLRVLDSRGRRIGTAYFKED